MIAPKTPVVHSESGYWIALMTDEGIRVFGSDGQDSTRKIPADTSVEALAVSNDGKRLVWMQSAGPLDSDLRTNDGVICKQEYTEIKFAMSPDGRWVLTDCGSSLHQFKLFDLAAHRFTSASVSNSRQRPVFDESGGAVRPRKAPAPASARCPCWRSRDAFRSPRRSHRRDGLFAERRSGSGRADDHQDRLRIFERIGGADFRPLSAVQSRPILRG